MADRENAAEEKTLRVAFDESHGDERECNADRQRLHDRQNQISVMTKNAAKRFNHETAHGCEDEGPHDRVDAQSQCCGCAGKRRVAKCIARHGAAPEHQK